jgi:cell wall-associated NlpC family hydrolase
VRFEDMQPGDAILMSIETSGLNHVAIYLGDQMILHHLRGRLSSRDIYGGYWINATGKVLRHASRLMIDASQG